MKPDIFMDNFERTECGDSHFAAVGRLLTLATRFERICKTITVLVEINNDTSLIDSEQKLESFISKLYRMDLAIHLTSFGFDDNSVSTILTNARLARNKVAHVVSIGLDGCLDEVPKQKIFDLNAQILELASQIAEGDKVISFAMSLLTNEVLPTQMHLKSYSNRLVDWVCEL